MARNPNAPISPFQLSGVAVEGSSLPAAELASAYAPFIGQTIDNQALAKITDAIAAAYADSNIALYTVLVPQQSFADGKLRLIAVEGYVGSVEVRGNLRRTRLPLLRAYLRRLETERPLHKDTLQRVVSLIRDMPGFYPDLSFEKGAAQGETKLVVKASEKPIQVALGVNDRGTALLGRTQAQADVLLNGLAFGGDQLRATVVLPAHVSRFQYYALGYSIPLNADGTTVSFNVSHLRTRPTAFPLEGDATSFGAQLSHPLLINFHNSLEATVGVDGLDSDNALLGFVLSNDRVRTLRTALAYTRTSERNELSLSATASFGLDALGARVDPDASDQRFVKLNLKAVDAMQLGKAVFLRLDAFAQISRDKLPASEQVALGGDEFGRAYEAAIIAGDQGVAGSAELAWRPPGLPKVLNGSELYVFADAGRVWNHDRFGFVGEGAHLASVGAGARLQVAARSLLQLEGVYGLNNPVFYEDRKKLRLLFSIRTLL